MFEKSTGILIISLTTIVVLNGILAADDYNVVYRDNSFEFGYDTPDSFHHSRGNRNNVVQGEFGGRNPNTGSVDPVQYTAGPRGYRPRGRNIARKYDLNQNGPRAVGNKDDPYYDPAEDPSYNFGFKTRNYERQEVSNSVGDVSGKISYIDDVGERHNVDFIAGKNTGFHVKTPFPDSNPKAYGPLFFKGRGKPIPRGRTSIERRLDGSYKFVSSGPDQRRTETSDATGHVRGSYTYLDDKGVQHTVHYIAGPETGYRVLKTVKGPHLPDVFPFGSPSYDYTDEVFTASESGRIKPQESSGNKGSIQSTESSGSSLPLKDDFGDIFGKDDKREQNSKNDAFEQRETERESDDGSYKPSEEDDGSYKPTGDDGSYKEESEQIARKYEDQDNCCAPGDTGINLQITEGNEGAFVTNLGKKALSVPPGVSIRAHVQAIDLVPLRPKVPSPGEQLKEELEERKYPSDQFGAESSENEKNIDIFADAVDATGTKDKSTKSKDDANIRN